MKDEIYIKNLDEVKKHLRLELGIFGDSLKKVLESFKLNDKNIPDSIKLSNLDAVEGSLKDIQKAVDSLNGSVAKIDFQPQVTVNVPDVHVPEIVIPPIYVPEGKAPNVTVSPIVDIDLNAVLEALEPLRFLSNSPKKPLSVRMSDGKEFLEQLTQAVSRGNEQLATVVSTSYGLTKDEYKAAQRELYDAATANNGATTVGATSTSVLTARNRISIILSNNSNETIYVAKGGTAVMNQGIRLNASGGAVVIDDWAGAISAICASGSKVLCYCETY